MSTEGSTTATNPQQKIKKQRAKRSGRISNLTHHNLTLKVSDENQDKRPFLKKRSGLFRFYKCMPMPTSLTATACKPFPASPELIQNLERDPSTRLFGSPMNSRRPHPPHGQLDNSLNSRQGTNNSKRSGTYSTISNCQESIPQSKLLIDNRHLSQHGGTETGGGAGGNDSQAQSKIPINDDPRDSHFEHVGDGRQQFGFSYTNTVDYPEERGQFESEVKSKQCSSPFQRKSLFSDIDYRPLQFPSPTIDSARQQEVAALRNSIIWPQSGGKSLGQTKQHAQESSGRKVSELSDDFIEEEIEDEIEDDGDVKYSVEQDDFEEEISMGEELSEGSSLENEEIIESKDVPEAEEQKQCDVHKNQNAVLTNQIAELHSELIAMKSKMASLEHTVIQSEKTKKVVKTKIPAVLPFRIDRQVKPRRKITVEGIYASIERISSELGDIQNGFIQKIESLEEVLHMKSQRWCENQIALADKVHSLFSELEVLSNRVKSQQHQVQNLAENVEKEFQNLKTEWKESQIALEKRIDELEKVNSKLIQNVEAVRSAQQLADAQKPETITVSTNIDTTASNTDQESQHITGPEPNFEKPVPSKNPSSMMMFKPEVEQSFGKPAGGDSEPKIECTEGQIVSVRKTLQNGDVETVYANGTREIIKADKSEVRHIYKNGDIRTVSPDGTVTYFYAESSTWQTTFPNGIEFFKFPNGVTERRLPNGLIEQTDTNGRLTFFQAAPAKPVPSLVLPLTFPSDQPERNPVETFEIHSGSIQYNHSPLSFSSPISLVSAQSPQASQKGAVRNSGTKLAPGERIIVFDNGDEEIHGPDYRKRVFSDGTVKTVYQDGSQETRYPNGRIRIKDGEGNLVADVTVSPDKVSLKPEKFFETETSTGPNKPKNGSKS